MKSTKFFNSGLVLLFILLFSSSMAQVQYEKTKSVEAIASERTKYEAKQLELDAEEVESLEQLNLMYTERMMALKKQTNSQNNKSEIEALNRSHSQKIKSLLSSEKYRKYLALKREEKKDKEQKKLEKQDW